MQIVSIDIKRSHYGATAEQVIAAFNVGKGQSALLGMAVSPEHRATVQDQRDRVEWKVAHTEGEALAKWQSVARHLDLVLAATKATHDFKARAAQLAA